MPGVHRVVALDEPVDDVVRGVLVASRVAGLDLDQEGRPELLDGSLPTVQDVEFAAFDVDLDEVKPRDARPRDQRIHRFDRHGHLFMAHELGVRPESGRPAREEGPAGYWHSAAERDAHYTLAGLSVESHGVLTQVLQALDSEDPPPCRVRELQRFDAVHVTRGADEP